MGISSSLLSGLLALGKDIVTGLPLADPNAMRPTLG
jgi:hypothetical protein